MSNTLGGVSLGQIAQDTLEVLTAKLPKLSVFTTDFSADVAVEGTSVSTRIPTQPTTGSLATGYAVNAQNARTDAVTITLGDVQGIVLGFTDSEWSKASVKLDDIFVKPGVNAIAKGMVDACTALVTAENFGAAGYTGTSFDYDDVTDLGTALTTAGVGEDRSMVLNATYFGHLLKDSTVKGSLVSVIAQEAVAYGRIPYLAGFSVSEYAGLGGNSENLVGFVCGKSAIAIAARVPATPDGFNGEIETVQDPDSGLTIQLRRWYSADHGKQFLSMGVMYGAAAGNENALKRIISASVPSS